MDNSSSNDQSDSDDFVVQSSGEYSEGSARDESTADHSQQVKDVAPVVENSTQDQSALSISNALSTSSAKLESSRQLATPWDAGQMLGRYRIVRMLGSGGFGHVFLCDDPQLRRQVAIKIPRPEKVEDVHASFLEEGRAVAKLDHVSIVRVFNIETTDDGIPFAVMEFVEGPTLRKLIRDKYLTIDRSVEILIQIAEALEYAHDKSLIHRDLKPANVIIADDSGRAKLMDFGMALHDLTPEENLTSLAEGTPPYMAPEQIRGENHRLDRRTDIWGFGTLMYLMLTGHKPFRGEDVYELMNRICSVDPIAPCRINPKIPTELERICLKCLSKLMNSRYSSMKQLQEDLEVFQTGSAGMNPGRPLDSKYETDESTRSTAITNSRLGSLSGLDDASQSNVSLLTQANTVAVVPKGMRSFDAQDAEFFLGLLPGPKDRFGIPDSLRFWINRLSIEADDPLTVGMIFGPSGCGKSSFVKAGLVPALPPEVTTVFLEATPENTEKQLLARFADIAQEVVSDSPSLPVAINRIRRGYLIKGKKVLIVLDQFEQWLQHDHDQVHTHLIEALRQCDGHHVSCLLLVRDDFWMSAAKFMSQLDMKIQEGVNSLAIPLFDRKHARKVLRAYGRANLAIQGDLTQDQNRFVRTAVNELADNGEVIPIHLSLFSQMMDSDSWQLQKLKQLGGWQGIGVKFLDKMFADRRIAKYSDLCRKVLRELLPASNSKIKGVRKSLGELAEATEMEGRVDQLQSILEVLDREFRVVSLTELQEDNATESHYQLTHDFLINPIRKWITQQEKQTWQGRANMRMAELSAQWQVEKDRRFMPSLLEYPAILLGVDRKSCKGPELQFLKRAHRFYGARIAVVLLGLTAVLFTGKHLWNGIQDNAARSRAGVLLAAAPQEVDIHMEALKNYDFGVINEVFDEQLAGSSRDQKTLHSLIAKAEFSSAADYPLGDLLDSIEWAKETSSLNVIRAVQTLSLNGRRQEILDELETRFNETQSNDQKVRLAITAMHVGELKLINSMVAYRKQPELRERLIDLFPRWHGDPSTCIELIDRESEPALLSGLIKMVGQITSTMSDLQQEELARIARTRIGDSQTPGVYSSFEWLLGQLDQDVPENLGRASNGSWMIESYLHGTSKVAFLRVDPQVVPGLKKGATDKVVEMMQDKPNWRAENEYLSEGFYMASSEVTAELFFEYVRSLDNENSTRQYFQTNRSNLLEHESQLPIIYATWYEACEFCNWLSRQKDLQEYYKPSEFEFGPQVIPTWEEIPEANGYRLPTNLQWDAANRAGTETRFCFGNSPSRLGRYAVTCFEVDSKKWVVEKVKSRMPNDYGFFDLMGNASDWCADSMQDEQSSRSTRGGDSASSGLLWFNSGVANNATINFRTPGGIRLVLPLD